MSGQDDYPSNAAVVGLILLMPFIWVWAIGMGMWDSARRLCR